jgi:hypothetical protein
MLAIIRCRTYCLQDCYHSVQNLLSSRLLSKNLKIKIYRTKILTLVFTGVKHGRSYEQMLRLLSRIVGLTSDEVTGK